mmetsp:Transcript_2934/g.4582  ORF Transcript_2934/g.4582 Transcript_2934/m.4582 type:complete len:507 (+) Transcript_2934:121-1641(+)
MNNSKRSNIIISSCFRSLRRIHHQSDDAKRLLRPLIDQLLQYYEDNDVMVQREHASPKDIRNSLLKNSKDVKSALEELCKYSVRTSSPLFLNQLYSGADPISIAGEFALAVTNTNAHTFEVSPAFSVIEQMVIENIGKKFGFDLVEGLTTPGGSVSNLYAMHLARYVADPDVKTRGAVHGPRLIALVSEDAHYSYAKAARVLGIGDNNLIKIPTRIDSGQMDTDILYSKLKEFHTNNTKVFFIGSTAGTTVRGSFDNLETIASISSNYNVWHHVDAAWGGAAIWSENKDTRALLRGVKNADSLAWNAHKLINVALPCAFFLTKRIGALEETNATHAPYLFQPEKQFREADFGDRTIMCGRKADSFKFWLYHIHYGDQGIAQRVDHCLRLARLAADYVANHSLLELVFPPSFANVCFRPKLPHLTADQLHQLPPLIKQHMHSKGDAMIGFQTHHATSVGNFFRLVITHGGSESLLTETQLTSMLDRIAQLALSLSSSGTTKKRTKGT